LEAEADEMWSFVQKKANKQWIWIAMDATTRQIIAFHVGDRSGESGKALWATIPMVYREQATFHTDQYGVCVATETLSKSFDNCASATHTPISTP
jgi:insertion element IS1 protein InsB